VAKAYEHFEEDGRRKDSADRDRVVDVMEELYKLSDRPSERKELAAKLVAQTAAKALE
jgi:arsenic resistance protein ArsH